MFLKELYDKEIKFLLTSDTYYNLNNIEHNFLAVGE